MCTRLQVQGPHNCFCPPSAHKELKQPHGVLMTAGLRDPGMAMALPTPRKGAAAAPSSARQSMKDSDILDSSLSTQPENDPLRSKAIATPRRSSDGMRSVSGRWQ